MIDLKQQLANLVWTAFQASRPFGRGFLQMEVAALITKDTFCYATMRQLSEMPDGGYELDTDYLMGRCVKTRFCIDKSGTLSVLPEIPTQDYQTWGEKYGNGAAMIAVATGAVKVGV